MHLMHRMTALMLLGLGSGTAVAFNITSAFNGGWYDPEHAGQGFTFEQVPGSPGRPELLVYFSTFDIDGTPTLLVGQAPVRANTVEMSLNRPVVVGSPAGGVFPSPILMPAGTLKISMFGCGAGTAEFNVLPRPGAIANPNAVPSKIRVGTGSINIQRLYRNFDAQRCTGGITDDIQPGEEPDGFEKFYTGAFVDARVIYEKRVDRAELKFDFRSLPIGSYTLSINGVPGPQFESLPFRDTTRGLLRFTSPQEQDTRLLDFQPRDLTITVSKIGEAAVTDTFRTPQRIDVLDTQPGFVGPPTVGSRQIVQSFDNLEVGGFGVRSLQNFLVETEYRQTEGATDFEISIEHAVPGYYDVLVEGKRRGTVYVLERPNGLSFGRARFRKPVESGTFPLDFDPRGQTVSFEREGSVEFTVQVNAGTD